MGFLSVIRRWALRDKMPIREISRRTGLSRNTIKKYLREGAVEPKFKTPTRPSKLDPYADRLSAWLLAQARKPRKERRTVKQMHADLVKLGYNGSYGHVAAFARAGRSWYGLTRFKPTRCCSTPTGMRSVFSAACQSVVSMTT